MNKIFRVLAAFAVTFVVATLLLGLSLRGYDIRDAQDSAGQRWATVHRLSGVAAALAVVLVNSIVVTYFVGTSRWCKEVAETYQLSPTFIVRARMPSSGVRFRCAWPTC